MSKVTVSLISCMFLGACGTTPIAPSVNHMREPAAPGGAGAIPAPLAQSATLAPPRPSVKAETYSVSVHNVSVQSLLFALARDARLNVDVHPGITGQVTLNALDQTMLQLLARISKQVDMRYEIDGNNLIVRPDSPFLRNYRVDYVNMARDSSSTSNIATQIATTGSEGGSGGSGNNNSTTAVSNTSNNRFWATLVENIKDTLRETDKVLAEGADTAAPAAPAPRAKAGEAEAPAAAARAPTYREAASVIANPETGLIAVRATARQHEKVQEFLDLVMSSARRQVMIEATVIEVQLNDNYQQGINWSSLRTSATQGLSLGQGQVGTNPLSSNVSPGITPGVFVMNYLKPLTSIGNLTATVQLLETFGKVKVLSSPKISVLNNQTALLKVVDNKVYFTLTATTTAATTTSAAVATYTSELHTVPVGFVMSVTPQIAQSDEVTLNVRPTISRIVGLVQDPNPALAAANVVSNVPVIQTREMESILRVASGNIAVMGGLMQDSVDNTKDMIPVLGRIPVVGDLFGYRNETTTKSELVIFIRPIVVKEASVNGDYKDFRAFLPDDTPLGANPYSEPARPARERRP